MSFSPFQKVILPGLFTASVVFTGLTLPHTGQSSTSLSERSPGPIQEWLSPLVQRESKVFSIRYIGLTVLVSSIAGITTAEILRKQQKRINRRQDLLASMKIAETAVPNGSELSTFSFQALAKPVQGRSWVTGLETAQTPVWEKLSESLSPSSTEASEFHWEGLSQSTLAEDRGEPEYADDRAGVLISGTSNPVEATGNIPSMGVPPKVMPMGG